ncbi:HD domain-containing phosphohydrolase [Roseibium algae]|uniref:HD domain-containing phosphohydrolase n=1 Tax=Roseibium algae TaxID=3123038 RepID=A0ABU8THM8_9HYPH
MATTMSQILVVDGDAKVLSAFERLFVGKYNVVTFPESEEALKWLKENQGVAVIVSCANLPGRGGAQFLKASEAIVPLATRIMLTAQSSVDVFKKAVNEAGVFMFLTKPCTPQELTSAVEAALANNARIAAERVLLEKTLTGSVKLMIDMLSLFHPEAFSRTAVMRRQALLIAKRLGMKKTWELEMSVMFSPLGEALLPKEILTRYRAARALSEPQREVLARAPVQTRDLLKNIPQLEKVAQALYLSGRGYDGSGFPEDGPIGKDIPLHSRVLKLLTDLWYASPEDGLDAASFEALNINRKQYDPDLLEVARACLLGEAGPDQDHVLVLCHIRELKPGDVLVDDVLTEGNHELVLSRGHQLSVTTIRRLDQYNHVSGVRQPLRIFRSAPVAEKKLEPASA